MIPTKLRTATLAACAALLLPAAAAQAGTVSQSGAQLVFNGGNESNSPFFSPEDGGKLRISDSVAITSLPGSCERTGFYPEREITCPMPGSLRVNLGGGVDDVGFWSEMPSSLPIAVYGDGGDDTLEDIANNEAGNLLDGGAGNDKLAGYDGNDTLRGGPGSDEIDGHAGADRLEGGDGNDTLRGDTYKSPSPDVYDGGAGVDQIDDWVIPSGDDHPPIDVSIDGQANDGRPGENDNVIAVEKFEPTVGGSFSGGDADEQFEIAWNAYEMTGSSTLRGNGGNDRLRGHNQVETIDGGSGADVLEGGYNHDTITGGAGPDMIYGDSTKAQCGWYGSCTVPFGNDTIDARDGEVDNVDCGVGQDTAFVDAQDIVVNCETVDGAKDAAANGAAPSPGAAPAGKATAAAKDAVRRAAAGDNAANGPKVIGARSLRALAAGRMKVAVPCSAACRVTVKLRNKRRTLATGSKTILDAGTAVATLKVGRKARGAVRRMRSAKLTLEITVKAGSAKPATTRMPLSLGR